MEKIIGKKCKGDEESWCMFSALDWGELIRFAIVRDAKDGVARQLGHPQRRMSAYRVAVPTGHAAPTWHPSFPTMPSAFDSFRPVKEC
jgi:hypothetical protein